MIRLARGEYFGSPTSIVRVAGLQITEARYKPQTRLPPHAHEQPYLCLVTSGGFEEHSRNYAALCGPGAVVWHPSGEGHEDAFGSHGGVCVNIEFAQEWLERLETAARRSWTYMRGGPASWLAGRIHCELSSADSVSSLAVEGLVCALLAEVHRSSPNSGLQRPAWLDRAVDRIRAEYREALTVTELAADAGVHRSHFVRSFHRHIGCTVGEFIRRRRIDWASEELRRADGPRIADLSLLAGFSDQAHFTRTFKRITGHTPARFRARAR
jgi:AraC family transcriptional regulator